MVNIEDIISYFPEPIRQARFKAYMLKEYIQYKILDYISKSKFHKTLSFLGGTCLRIVHGSQRFSEDIDFDHFDISGKEFEEITDYILNSLCMEGYPAEIIDKEKDEKLKAFRRNIYFPGLLYTQGISPHKNQRFLIKIEAQSHNFFYKPIPVVISGFDVHTIINVTPPDILLSMKISAMLNRKKGRDFYDFLMLVHKTKPNYEYLAMKTGIKSSAQLRSAILHRCKEIDFNKHSQDFQHLVFNPSDAAKIKDFEKIFLAVS